MLGGVCSDGAGASAAMAGGRVGRRGGRFGGHAAHRDSVEEQLHAAQPRVDGCCRGVGGRASRCVQQFEEGQFVGAGCRACCQIGWRVECRRRRVGSIGERLFVYFQLKSSQNVSAVLVPGAAVHTLAVVVPELPSNTKSTCVLCGMSAIDTDAPAAGTIIWPYDVKKRTY